MRTLAIIAACAALGGCANALDAEVQSVHALKVRDAMNAYEKASASAPLDRCVKAKMVALAYADANDPTSAAAWHAREKVDCEAAMVALGAARPAQPAD